MKYFKKEDSVILLIDHQVGTLNFAANRPKEMIVNRTTSLAKLAKELDIPVLLTTSQEDHFQGLLIAELQEILPDEYSNRIKRNGITNAWNDPNYKAAVLKAANGRKNIIMAGLTNDVCIVFPSISMQEEGFNVVVVIDAGGSPTHIAEEIARSTWEKEGVRTTTITQLFAEIVADWNSDEGTKAVKVLAEDVIPTFGKFA